MIPNSISAITAHLLLVTLFLLSRTSFGTNHPYYEACAPRSCGQGNYIISYPFYIQGQQEPYCGFPGFELNCTDNNGGYPRIRISEDDYIVEEIHYNNQSFRVSNAAVSSNSATECFPRIRNVTLERNSVFRLGSVSNLVLFSDCQERLSERLMSYTNIGCNVSSPAANSSLAMTENDGNFGLAEAECKEKVVAPVEIHGGDGRNGIGGWNYYRELLRRGFLLNWTASDCSACDASGGRCGFNSSSLLFMCLCRDHPHSRSCKSRKKRNVSAIIAADNYLIPPAAGASLVAVVMITVFLLVCIWRKCSSCKSVICLSKITDEQDNFEVMLKNFGPIAPERFRYSDIKKMTNSFKKTLGQGGFGHVYRGTLRSGKLVAVKVLNGSKGNGEDFINEVASISRTSHVNIVGLLGFCFEGREKRALVYEFMPNGSLEKFIYDQRFLVDRQLAWETLYQISVGIARGLEYLHRGCNTRILHFDIKPHNILLDENFCPKIADFGLAKLCPGKESILSTMTARGTVGYIAPEVFCRNIGGVSYKSDVYSYGMMVSEMVGGRKNIDVRVAHTSEIYFPHWIHKQLESNNELGLHGIVNEDENKIARKMIIVSLWCIQTDPFTRPSMTRVVEMLEGSLESLQIPPKPYLSSPSRSPN